MSLKTWRCSTALSFPPRLGDWQETDGYGRPQQEEADAAEPESWTHRHELNPVNPVDCKAGGFSLKKKDCPAIFFSDRIHVETIADS